MLEIMRVYCLKHHLDQIGIGIVINKSNELGFWVWNVTETRV